MAYRKKSVRRKVQSIIDGDTIKVRRKVRGSQYIRIAGLNAPEKGGEDMHLPRKTFQELTARLSQ